VWLWEKLQLATSSLFVATACEPVSMAAWVCG
jgi:hypothetical protein